MATNPFSVRAAPAVQPHPEASAPAPEPQTGGPSPVRTAPRNIKLWLVLGLIAAGVLGYGTYWFAFLRGSVRTDDAYIDAPIISVSARLSGRVDAVLAQEGDRVQKGQVLLRLATDKLEIQMKQVRAQVEAAEARLQELTRGTRSEELDVARAEIRVGEVELKRRQVELNRTERLAKIRAATGEQLDNAKASMADSEAKLNVARRRLQLLQAGARDEQVNRARAELEMARAHFASAETDLADAVLHAPVDGIVARRRVQAGEVVEDKQGVFQIVENGKTWVVANLEEGQIARVAVGQPVEVVVDAYPSRVFRARVGPQFAATLSRFSLLSSSSASGSFIKVTQRVPVRIDWAQDTLPPLVPGLNVTVRIQVDSN